MVEPTHLKNIGHIGSFPQGSGWTKNIWVATNQDIIFPITPWFSVSTIPFPGPTLWCPKLLKVLERKPYPAVEGSWPPTNDQGKVCRKKNMSETVGRVPYPINTRYPWLRLRSMGRLYIWVRVARSWPPPPPPQWYGPPPYPAVLAATVVVLVLVLRSTIPT